MSEHGKLGEPYPATQLHEEISKLTGFDRCWYIFGRILQTTRGTTVKVLGATTKKTTADESVLHYLQKVAASSYETGLSAKQIASKIEYKRTSVNEALTKLVNKRVVMQEQRGRNIKYYLPTSTKQSRPEE